MKHYLEANQANVVSFTCQAGRSEGAVVSSSAEDTESCLSCGSEIIGTVFFRGPAVIEGKVEGKIDGDDKIRVGEQGSLSTDELRADSIVIGGTVKVKSIASRRIEILPTGKVWADLDSSLLIIHEGALFKGRAFARALGRNPDDPGTRAANCQISSEIPPSVSFETPPSR